jgi:hypothetical protein
MITFSKGLLAGAAFALVWALPAPTEARPLPVATAAALAGEAPVATVQWRRHGGFRGYRGARYGYYPRHRGYRAGPAIAAGAAFGLLGLAAAASAAPAYSPYYYPSYGYAPVYAAPAYYPYYGYPATTVYYGTTYAPAYYAPRPVYRPRRVYYGPRFHGPRFHAPRRAYHRAYHPRGRYGAATRQYYRRVVR